MAGRNRGAMVAIALGLCIPTLYACQTPVRPPGAIVVAPGPSTMPLFIRSQLREAESGGYVTVDFGVFPGPVPELNMRGAETRHGWYSNRGEGGKREKLYKWKPRKDAEYDLVLSADLAFGKTRWTMYETDTRTRMRRQHLTGHLEECEKYHPPVNRDAGFKDCGRTLPSVSPGARSFRTTHSGLAAFASSFSTGEPTLQSTTGRGWIACDYGCCSLQAQ
jgi:hypothetical protein